MEYIISEEELIKLLKEYRNDHRFKAESFTEYFLKSKQPVKLVAEGRMIVDEDNKPKIYTFRENDHWAKPGTQMGSLYKIYSQKIKD